MKKKAIIISASVLAVLAIVTTVVLVAVLKNDYFDEVKYDHISEHSYNGVSVVGEDGLFYLVRDGEHLSEGYVYLKSVNDYYEDIEASGAKTNSDLVLFDYYVAHRSDSASYYLVTSTGEEYLIVGDNYSLDEVKLPYLIFTNNTTSQRAVISLLKIDSDLSYKSGNDINLKPFSKVYAVRADDEKVLCTHLYTIDEAADKSYSFFCNDGTLIVSSEHLEFAVYKDLDDDRQQAVYVMDMDENSVYSSRGELLSTGDTPLVRASDVFGYTVRLDQTLGYYVMDVFSVKGMQTLSNAQYDFSAVQVYDGSVMFTLADGRVALLNVLSGEISEFSSIEFKDGILFAQESDGSYSYLDVLGNRLINTSYSDLLLNKELSEGDCYVFTSEGYRGASGNGNAYHFTHAKHGEVTLNFDPAERVELLYANLSEQPADDGSGALVKTGEIIEGSFLISYTAEDKDTYRICTPFAANPLSDSFDVVDAYCQAEIYWARCASYERGVYDIIDPIANQKAGTVVCEEENFAKLSFAFAESSLMIPDVYDEDSGIPVILLTISKFEDDDGTTDSVRYYALYRSANCSSKNFDSGILRISEVGSNLLRSTPYSFFNDDNCLVLNGMSMSRIFRFNDSKVLTEAASVPYKVIDVLFDRADPSLIYYLVEAEGGKKGLYDSNGTKILAPYYDGIYSLDSGRFTVSLRGGVGVFEYKNEKLVQLIDYSYSDIVSLIDGAYVTYDGNGHSAFFVKDKLIMEEPIQSYTVLVDYSLSSDGVFTLTYDLLVSCEGKLYLHDGELTHRARAEQSVSLGDDDFTDISNDRAILVNYYVGGKLYAKKTVYPTDRHFAAFELEASPDGKGWFASQAPSEQLDPITKESIISGSEYIVELYPKTNE